eukprot:TRINITY_DN9708_c0_g2_i1.p1 TRINITY_DN9708_c0_g2~~TRINITY_DN9708_c0_g2_i1.p1  ORF type:complete len:775 (+),score=254.05 TRINITY_DN9708_c0_g2_i1:80-2326(+)
MVSPQPQGAAHADTAAAAALLEAALCRASPPAAAAALPTLQVQSLSAAAPAAGPPTPQPPSPAPASAPPAEAEAGLPSPLGAAAAGGSLLLQLPAGGTAPLALGASLAPSSTSASSPSAGGTPKGAAGSWPTCGGVRVFDLHFAADGGSVPEAECRTVPEAAPAPADGDSGDGELWVASRRNSVPRDLMDRLRTLHGFESPASPASSRRFVGTLETACEEVWENERWMVVKGWSRPLGPERSHWSDKSGTRVRLREGVLLPYLWEWADEWHVDEYEGSIGGWYYAGDFTTSIRDCRPQPSMSTLVRRRRWVRTRTRISEQPTLLQRMARDASHWLWCQREHYGFPDADPLPPPSFSWIEDQRRHAALAVWKSYFESTGGLKAPLRFDGKPGDVKGKVKALLRKHGCPSQLRQKLWLECSGAARKKRENAGYYDCVVERHRGDTRWAGRLDVERDLQRTFTEHCYFNHDGAPGRARLGRVLSAISYRNPLINYCQSFNYVAASLLLNSDEEDSFWLMITLLEDILPNDYYNKDLVGITVDLRVMDDVMREVLPTLAQHLRQHNMDPTPFMAGWLMNLYVGVFPIDVVFRIWDIIFSEGMKVVFRVMLAVLKLFEADILRMTSLGELLEFLTQRCKAVHCADELIQAANSFRVGRTMLSRLREPHRVAVMEEVAMRRAIERETALEAQRRGHADPADPPLQAASPPCASPTGSPPAPPGFSDSWEGRKKAKGKNSPLGRTTSSPELETLW